MLLLHPILVHSGTAVASTTATLHRGLWMMLHWMMLQRGLSIKMLLSTFSTLLNLLLRRLRLA
jgi:hypothetical protein